MTFKAFCDLLEDKAVDVKDIRKRTGLSRAAFSAYYGIPVRTLEDWERGVRTAPPYVLKLLLFAVQETETTV